MAPEIEQEVLEKCDREVKVQSKIATTLVAARGNKERHLSAVIDATRFNNWNKLLRVTALVRKFIAALKNPVIDRSIVAEDIQLAERLWVIELQTSLKENREYFDKLNEDLELFEEDGLIRCAGRFRRSVLPYSSKSYLTTKEPSSHRFDNLALSQCSHI